MRWMCSTREEGGRFCRGVAKAKGLRRKHTERQLTGHGRHVAEYLRWHGKLRNRKIRKGELERLINNVWKEKARHEEQKAPIAMADFFHLYR
eukprot:gene4762-62100_t